MMIDLDKLKSLCAKATQGPWDRGHTYCEAGVNDGSHKDWAPKSIQAGECAYCGDPDGHLIATKQIDGGNFHIHRFENNPEEFRSINAADGTMIVGVYDHDEGGVATNADDADFICASRTAMPELIAEIERLQEKLNHGRHDTERDDS